MRVPVVFEDLYLVVIDKPPGVVVNRSENVSGETIQDWAEEKILRDKDIKILREQKKSFLSDFYNRAGIVHRLDKETSGLLIIAKDPSSFLVLQSQFAARTITKKYQALTHGRVEPSVGVIKAPVGRLPWNRRKFGVFNQGREAVTSYQVEGIYSYRGEEYSLITAIPHTGRTHQIRVHLKYLGHPVVGDKLYAGRKMAKLDSQFCPRLFLHANYLKFIHPKTGKAIEIQIELAPDLEKVLQAMRQVQNLSIS